MMNDCELTFKQNIDSFVTCQFCGIIWAIFYNKCKLQICHQIVVTCYIPIYSDRNFLHGIRENFGEFFQGILFLNIFFPHLTFLRFTRITGQTSMRFTAAGGGGFSNNQWIRVYQNLNKKTKSIFIYKQCNVLGGGADCGLWTPYLWHNERVYWSSETLWTLPQWHRPFVNSQSLVVAILKRLQLKELKSTNFVTSWTS